MYRLSEESMRWLELQGKHDQVISVLKKIAIINKKTLPDLPTNVHIEVNCLSYLYISANILVRT